MNKDSLFWWRRTAQILTRNRMAVLGAVLFCVIAGVAILAPFIAPYDPLSMDVLSILQKPGASHWLGTDEFGRDIFSRLIWGTRISLIVGICSVLLGMIMGTAMGMIAGYFGGKIATAIMRGVDILMCFPDLLLGLAIMALLGASLANLIISIAIVLTPRFARLAYAPTLVVKNKDYTQAARAIGASAPRIIMRHVLPNIFGEILVAGTLWVGEAIRLEANLSFIGLAYASQISRIRVQCSTILANAVFSSLFSIAARTSPWRSTTCSRSSTFFK